MKPREEAAGKVKVAELAGAMCMEELCQLRSCILATRYETEMSIEGRESQCQRNICMPLALQGALCYHQNRWLSFVLLI